MERIEATLCLDPTWEWKQSYMWPLLEAIYTTFSDDVRALVAEYKRLLTRVEELKVALLDAANLLGTNGDAWIHGVYEDLRESEFYEIALKNDLVEEADK